MTENPVHCSFCHKSQHDVTKVVAGDGVFICNECIDLAYEIVHEVLPSTG